MEEINLYDLIKFYAKKWLTILIFVMLGAIAGVAYTYFIQQPEYKSSATLLLIGTGRTTANQESVVINNYTQLFTSRRVLEPVINDQKYSGSYRDLSANTTATNTKNTDIVEVSISTRDSKTSRALLQSAIQKFREEAKSLYGDNALRINIVDNPSTPNTPENIQPLKQIGLATAAGLALSIIYLFFVYDYRMTKVKRIEAGH